MSLFHISDVRAGNHCSLSSETRSPFWLNDINYKNQ